MKKKIIHYTNEPMKVGKRVKDFLPSPAELSFKEDTKKITLALTKRSIAFFKNQSRKHKLKYQPMIREILDKYVSLHS